MQQRLATDFGSSSVVSTHKVLRNTYMLLGLTLAFSAVVAFIAMAMGAPRLPWWGMLAGFYGLLF